MVHKKERTLPNSIKDEIIKDIMMGEIRPNDKILEEKYAKKMGASRASVREAIFMLVREGIATKIENRGTYLNDYTLDEQLDLFSIRFFLEKKALTKLRQNTDIDALIERLEMWNQQMEEQLDFIFQLAFLNYQFHFEFIQWSGSRVLIERYPSFFTSVAFMQNEMYARNGGELVKPVEDHKVIIEALKARDFQKVEDILTVHYEDVIALLNSVYNV